MTIDDQIRDKKLQYDINREDAEISALLSKKVGKYKYLTGEEILPSNQKQVIEQAKVTYSPLGKAFLKQIKNNSRPRKKQVKALEDLRQRTKKKNKEKQLKTNLIITFQYKKKIMIDY